MPKNCKGSEHVDMKPHGDFIEGTNLKWLKTTTELEQTPFWKLYLNSAVMNGWSNLLKLQGTAPHHEDICLVLADSLTRKFAL